MARPTTITLSAGALLDFILSPLLIHNDCRFYLYKRSLTVDVGEGIVLRNSGKIQKSSKEYNSNF